MSINLNKLAVTIAKGEGKKVSLPIGQIKEVVKITLGLLSEEWAEGREVEVIQLLKRVQKRNRKVAR